MPSLLSLWLVCGEDSPVQILIALCQELICHRCDILDMGKIGCKLHLEIFSPSVLCHTQVIITIIGTSIVMALNYQGASSIAQAFLPKLCPPPLLNKSNLYNLGATPKKIYVILEWRSGLKSIIKYTALIYQLTQAFKWRISSDLRLNGAFMSLYIFFSLVRIHIICWNILSPGPPIICSCNTLSLPYSLLKLISFAMTCSLTTKNMSYGRL